MTLFAYCTPVLDVPLGGPIGAIRLTRMLCHCCCGITTCHGSKHPYPWRPAPPLSESRLRLRFRETGRSASRSGVPATEDDDNGEKEDLCLLPYYLYMYNRLIWVQETTALRKIIVLFRCVVQRKRQPKIGPIKYPPLGAEFVFCERIKIGG